MKLSECNSRQKKAFINIKHAGDWLVGGLENTMLDNAPNSKEYKNAESQLNDHALLVDMLYDMAITEIYGDGFMSFGVGAEMYLKDIRFCGKEWLMARCEARIKKLGY